MLRVDARGVRCQATYDNDALGRLRTIGYDLTGVPATATVDPAGPIAYHYVRTGDLNRVERVESPHAVERREYDVHGRLELVAVALPDPPGREFTVEQIHDAVDRVQELAYPTRDPDNPSDRYRVWAFYGEDGRINRLHDGDNDIEPTFDPAGALETLHVAMLRETYVHDPQTGALTGQEVWRGDELLLALDYRYVRPGQGPHTTGQIVSTTDRLDARRSCAYAYDATKRLRRVTGGDPAAPAWSQEYAYDLHGNRTAVTRSGAMSEVPVDGIPLSFDTATDRVAQAGFEYDDAGNLTRAPRGDGTWQRYRYDAAGRLAAVTDDAGDEVERYAYMGCRRRRLTINPDSGARTIHVWSGDTVISEHVQIGNALHWAKDLSSSPDGCSPRGSPAQAAPCFDSTMPTG